MPTVVDPETKAKTNPAEAPIVKERELFADEVEMERKSSELGPLIMALALVAHLARVDYTWKWVPNRLGKEFDAAGDLVHSFNTWDRGTLIKNYGVDFYSAPPAKASVVLVEGKDGLWKTYVE